MMMIASLCYALAALGALVFGLSYLFRPRFTSYHRDAVGVEWEALEPRFQTLFLALLRVGGGSLVANGFAALWLIARPFWEGETWAKYSLPLVGLISSLSVLYATYLVKTYTPASPPFKFVLALVGLLIVGFILSMV
jgi:hypothetical protein